MPNAKKLSAQARRENQGAAKPRATRMFTDRENLRGAYHALAERAVREDFEDVYVINYYGVGGAGKSMLLRKLRDEVTERAAKDPDRRHLTLMLDFDTVPADVMTALEHLKAQLQKQGFRFQVFELALCTLYEKNGWVLTEQEQADFFARNPEADIVADLVDLIPGVGTVTNLIRNAAKLGGHLKGRARELLESHRRALYEIEKMDENALQRNLPMLFAEDVNGQLGDSDELHIFIDTYEKMVSRSEGKRADRTTPGNDQWLYGRDGLIRNLGNAVFAISGREKLHWAENEYWKDRIESHLTAHLSEADSSLFLSSCGVPGYLWPALYKLTGGEPVFLDLCVDRYLDLQEMEKTPRPEDFGRDVETLVERHTRYLPENLLDAAYLLGGMRRWNKPMFDRAAQAAGIQVNPSGYQEKLMGLSYVTDEGQGVWSMHQVIAGILVSRFPEDLARKASEALADLALEGLKQEEASDQTLVLEAAVALAGEKARTEALARAQAAQARAEIKRLRFSQAQQWRQAAVDTYRAVLGPEHPDTLEALADLGSACYRLGDNVRARELLEQAYEAQCRVQGPEHLGTLASLGNLAACCGALGDHARARQLEEQVYEARMRVLGPEDPSTLRALGNLAVSCAGLGDYARGRELLERAYETQSRVQGPEHPDALAAQVNLAVCCGSLGDYARARELLEQAYEAHDRVLGPEHPHTLRAQGNLAYTCGALGDHVREKELLEQAYEVQSRVLGPEHPDTLLTLGYLARSCRALGDYSRAREMLEQICEAQSRVLGPEHPETLITLGNLAVCCGNLGDYARERALEEQIYETQDRVLGPEHPDTRLTLWNLANTCIRLGDFGRARGLFGKLYEIQNRVLGPKHPDTRKTMQVLKKLREAAAKRRRR